MTGPRAAAASVDRSRGLARPGLAPPLPRATGPCTTAASRDRRAAAASRDQGSRGHCLARPGLAPSSGREGIRERGEVPGSRGEIGEGARRELRAESGEKKLGKDKKYINDRIRNTKLYSFSLEKKIHK